jgi:iron complex outermembrane receptor protein
MSAIITTVRVLIPTSSTGALLRRAAAGACTVVILAAAAMAQTPEEPAETKGQEEKAPAERYADTIEVVAPAIAAGTHVTREGTLVTSVSADQIRDLAASDLASALRWLPGVTISRYNPVGSYGGGDGGAVYLRGQGAGRPGAEVSMLFDGIPRFVGVWTHPLLDVFPVEAAGRLDVYRSAQPVLLGTMAFGAVDLVPRRLEPGTLGGHAAVAAGSFSTWSATVELGSGGDDVDFDVVASRRQSDGHREGAGGQVDSIFGRFGARLSEHWSLRVVGSRADSWAEDPGRTGEPQPPTRPRFGVVDTLVVATAENRYAGSSGHVKAYLEDGTIDWLQWDGATREAFTTLTDYHNAGLRARQTFVAWPGGEVVVGADHDRYGGAVDESRPSGHRVFPRRTFENTAGYAMVSHRFQTAIEVIPSVGVRYNSSADFGGDWGGQAGLVLRRGGTEVHANVARGFNLPGVWVAVSYEQWGLGDSYRTLGAERLDHAEIGLGQQLSPVLRLGLNVFRDKVRDALRFDPPPPPPPSFSNLGTYTVVGAEASLTASLSDRVAVFLGGTHLDTDPATVPNAPEWAWVGGVNLAPAAGWKASVDAEWVDAQEVLNPRYASGPTHVDAHALVNGRLAYAFTAWSSPVEVFVAGENLGDSAYEYRPGYPMPGRSWSTGLDVRF